MKLTDHNDDDDGNTLRDDISAGMDSNGPKEEHIKDIADVIRPFYEVEHYRSGLVVALASFLRKELAFQRPDCHEIMQKLAPGNIGNIELVNQVYEKKMRDLSGADRLQEILLEITNNDSKRVAEIISKIRVFSKGKRKSSLADVETMLSTLVTTELLDNVYAVISYHPLELIIAHRETKQVIRASIQDLFDKDGKKAQDGAPLIKYGEIVFGAIPVEIVKYDSPNRVEIRYEIVFESRNARFKLGPGNIDELVAGLKVRSLVFRERHAQDTLSTLLNAYEVAGKATVSKEIDTPGFYLLDGKICPVKTRQKKPTNEEIKQCARVVDELVGYYDYKPVVFSTTLKWATIAPFSYIIKSLGSWLPGLYWYGQSNAGKTALGDIALAVWRKYHDLQHDKSFPSFNTEARVGEAISQDSYPVLVNEASAFGSGKYDHIVEMLKHAIEKQTGRATFKQKHIYQNIPALSPWIITSNGIPPADVAFRRKHYLGSFVLEDKYAVEKKGIKTFERWFASKAVPGLGILGDFVSDYILTHPDRLLQHRNHAEWVKELGKEILIEFFKIADEGRSADERPIMRQWLHFDLPDPIENMVEATEDLRLIIRGFLLDRVNQAYRQYYEKTKGDPSLLAPLKERLDFVLDNDVISFLRVYEAKDGDRIVITSDIQSELRRQCIDDPPSLENLGAIMGLNYGPTRLSLDQVVKAVFGAKETLLKFLE
jgi:hypothetical protein